MSKEKYSEREQETRDRLAETLWEKRKIKKQNEDYSKKLAETTMKNRKLEKQNKDYSKRIENHNLTKGMVPHDLNGPLANISNANYLLRNNIYGSDEEKEWMHDQIERNAEKSSNVLDFPNFTFK